MPELMVAMTKDYPSDVIYGSASGGSTEGDSCLSIRPPAGEKEQVCPKAVYEKGCVWWKHMAKSTRQCKKANKNPSRGWHKGVHRAQSQEGFPGL